MSGLIYLQPRDNPEYYFRQLIHDINTNFSAGTSGSGGGSPIQNGLNTYTGGTISAQTINVSALTIDNVYVSGNSLFNSITATTYYNLPTDVYVTGGTYSAGTAVFSNSTGGTFNVTGFSNSINFTGATNYYSKFNSGGTIQDGMISDNGISSSLSFAASGDNINVLIKSPAGFYYPSLIFVNNGGTGVGQITGYAGRLYVSPLSVGGTIDMGANKIVNLSPGTNVDDAINLGQLKDVTILSSTTACTISIDAYNTNYSITALTSACTFSVVSGNEQNFDRLIVRVKDGGVAQSLTFNPVNFEAKGQALPTTTVANKLLTAGFIYDDITGKFGCVTVAQEI